MGNLHLLPTYGPSMLAKSTKSGLNAAKKGEGLYESGRFGITTFNIYITNDEEIKGDWFIYKNEIIHRDKGDVDSIWVDAIKNGKKIILTTDRYLIRYGVQPIDDEFLEWFVKNPSCEKVKTYYIPNEFRYEIIIPKEEPKQELSARLKNSLSEFNINLYEAFDLLNWQLKTIGFSNRSILELKNLKKELKKELPKTEIELINGFLPTEVFNKKETLEDAAQKYFHSVADGKRTTGYCDEDFIAGGKWEKQNTFQLFKKLVLRGCFKTDRDYKIAKQTLLEVTGIDYEEEIDKEQ